jgi:prolyl-tRNA editing enzyme YbaK/EbsC (Cys-tRNA(Pro) deacylase)
VIFRRKSDDVTVVVMTSGDRRVDEKKVAALAARSNSDLGRADAELVKTKTGFSIGGVSPLAHLTKPVTLIDRDLFRFEVVWAAAGHPHGVFPLSPDQLVTLTGAPAADLVHAPA